MAKKVVIIGGGIAGIYVLRNLLVKKEEVEEGVDLTLIKKEKSGWVSTCGLPFALRGLYGIDDTEINGPKFFIDQGVDFRTETEVTKINLGDSASSVTLNTGEGMKYDYLVIATGRKPSIPPAVEGTKLGGVYTFNNEEDAEKIAAAMNAKDAKNAFVRGRGIIGLQAAAAFSVKGLKTTVLGGPPSLLPTSLDPDMGDMLKEWLEKKGIRFILERKEIIAIRGDGGKVKSVVIGEQEGKEEEEIPADVVVIARGMNPKVDLAKEAGIVMGESRGIVTDSSMHVKKGRKYINNIFALGDCTEVIDGITYRPRLSQLASTAVMQAKVIADNIFSDISGQADSYSSYEPCLCPTVADIADLLIGSVGITSEVASRNGMKIITGKATRPTKARYFPGGKPITVKLIFDAYTEKLIGAQIISEETVAERINELELAIKSGMTAMEICNTERCYDPSLELLKDVTINAVENALGRHTAN